MKYCFSCKKEYPSSLASCSGCNYSPNLISGFKAYSPELAQSNEGFDATYFSELIQLEEGNFWFRSRNKLIKWGLRAYAPRFKSLLEIGCGTGFVLSSISRNFPNTELSGSEIFINGLKYASQRLPETPLIQMDARKIPFSREFDVIGAFDVLEHIQEDQLVLSEINRALKPGGILILTVPQHQWLWSASDDYAYHKRRYESGGINTKLTTTGFQILRSSSFVSILLPAMMISRLKNPKKFNPKSEFKISKILNLLFEGLLTIERFGIKLGLNYPIGGSRIIIARKLG